MTTLTDRYEGQADTTADGLGPGLTLVFSNGLGRAGEQVSLSGRSALMLGRETPVFPGGPLLDARMSARHAGLVNTRGRWVLADGPSKNGTFVNGVRVTDERLLEPGDVVRLGSTLMVFAPVVRNDGAREPVSELVGVSASMARARADLALVAPTEQTVVLLGETGTGKELAARELHRLSGRTGPLLAVNCASLRGELLESELFGHVRGAFTGALRAHDGLFVRASAGTLLLDEVGELDEVVQSRLLRVLEAKAVRPVGASEEVPIGTRVVAATHRDLEAAVRSGRLRADLYARLARWTVTLPSLRERLEDLGVLARAILAPRSKAEPSPELMAALLANPWPLNVRGLVNVLSTAAVAQPGAERLELVPQVAAALASQAKLAVSEGQPERSEAAAGEVPGREQIEATLRAHRGNLAAVARELGLTRQSLYRALERLGLNPAEYRSPR